MVLIQLALSLFSLAVIVALVAATNSLLLQGLLTITRLRGWLLRRFVLRWIRARTIHNRKEPNRIEWILSRLRGRAAAAYAYDAPYPQICAQVSNATRAAIEMMTSDAGRDGFGVGSAESVGDPLGPPVGRVELEDLLRVFGGTASAADFESLFARVSAADSDRRRGESISRVIYHVERGVDSLQATLGARWAQVVYGFSLIFSIGLLFIVARDAAALRAAFLSSAVTQPTAPVTDLSVPSLLLAIIVTLSVLVTPYTTRLFERAGRIA